MVLDATVILKNHYVIDLIQKYIFKFFNFIVFTLYPMQ